jgi:diaminohydroxyphosphoribosylaminopyrimidine deaminase/5-amino-6-(5-phosphoribosylamino)uracil reductase
MEHQPLPVVIGERAIPGDAKLWEHPRGVLESGSRNLDEVLAWLFEQGIRRTFVEGGPTLASAFIAAGLVDEYAIYLAPKLLGGPRVAIGDIGVGSIGEARELQITAIEQLGDDLLVVARPKEQ